MSKTHLTTVAEVLEALGGTSAVAAIVGSKYSSIWMWKKSPTLPTRTYLILKEALEEKGLSAPSTLWGMLDPSEDANNNKEQVA